MLSCWVRKTGTNSLFYKTSFPGKVSRQPLASRKEILGQTRDTRKAERIASVERCAGGN